MKHDLNNKNFERKAKRVYSVFACVALLLVATAVPALAAGDPLTVVNNLSDFIFGLMFSHQFARYGRISFPNAGIQ